MNTLELRNRMKSKKPRFRAQQGHIHKQLAGAYRRPPGIHSKTRESRRGKISLPSIGYASPRATHGLDHNGRRPVLTATMQTLEQINTQTEVAVLTHTLGLRKRIQLLTRAKEKSIPVANVKDIDAYLANAKKMMEEKKKQHQTTQEQKKKAKEELEKKAAEKKKKEQETPKETKTPEQSKKP